jgi:hypothetical protein
MWQSLRAQGWPIVSSWIDEAGEGETGDFTELWQRIHDEIAASCGVVLYAEESDFPMKGAFIECGMAIGMGKPVAVVLKFPLMDRSMRPLGSWANHPLVKLCQSLDQAKRYVQSSAAPSPAAPQPVGAVDERALFEAYFAEALRKAYPFMPADCVKPKLSKHADGDYVDLITQHDWKVWQARASLAPVAAPIDLTLNCSYIQRDASGKLLNVTVVIDGDTQRLVPAPVSAQQGAAPEDHVVFFRQDSSFGPWIECDADHVNAVRFVRAAKAPAAQAVDATPAKHPLAGAAWGRLASPASAPEATQSDDLAEIIAGKVAEIKASGVPLYGYRPTDAQRYERLRVLGAAPGGSKQLAAGTVLCFQGLDDFVDADIVAYPSRGEAEAAHALQPAAPKCKTCKDEGWVRDVHDMEQGLIRCEKCPAAAPAHAGGDDAKDAARYRVLRLNAAPADVAFSMGVASVKVRDDEQIEECIDRLCDGAIDRAAQVSAHQAKEGDK